MFFRVARLLKTVGRDVMTMWFAWRHPSTPRLFKVATLLLTVYVISPLDLIPDWFPLLGWIDDATLLALLLPALLKLLPHDVLHYARTATSGKWPRLRLRR